MDAKADANHAADHVIAAEHLRAPESYADAFAVLGGADLLPAELMHAGKEMARFRNVLVHLYAEVDDRRVVRVLRNDLNGLDSLCAAMAATVGDEEE